MDRSQDGPDRTVIAAKSTMHWIVLHDGAFAIPTDAQGLRFIGVELDSISGRIARVLHPKADIRIENFRNFAELDVELAGSVVVVGENRVGKSNLVHALRLIFDVT